MSLVTPEKIRRLQRKLYEVAKQRPEQRFHALYDKVYRSDILAHAYACCRANGGAPGVDGVDFGRIELAGRVEWLQGLAEELRAKNVRNFLQRRHKVPGRGTRRFSDAVIHGELGVLRLRWVQLGRPVGAES